MKNRFILGALTGVVCSLLAFAVFFTFYVYKETKDLVQANQDSSVLDNQDTDSYGTSEDASSDSTESETTQISEDEVFSKIEYIKNMIDTYSLYGVSTDDLVEGIYKGMMESLDDKYAMYYTEDEFTALKESSSGTYCGIGALVSQDMTTGIITIVKPFVDGPAYNAGMLPGDIVYMVDDVDVTEMDLTEVVRRMKGDAGTDVVVTVYREGNEEPIDFEIIRDWITVETVESEMLDNNVGYVAVSEFDEVTVDQFISAIDTLEEEGMTSLVLDLRNNPGGLVDSAVAMLDRLLPPGLLVYTEDKDGNREEEYAEDDLAVTVPIVILMNGQSASASEIFAGAMQDYGAAVIMGEQSYGKGIVQVVAGLYDNSGIKLTISEYFTPLGNKVHGIGITPDVEVTLNEDLAQLVTIPKEDDNQLQAAISYLLDQQE